MQEFSLAAGGTASTTEVLGGTQRKIENQTKVVKTSQEIKEMPVKR
jgi:hypothetical protein